MVKSQYQRGKRKEHDMGNLKKVDTGVDPQEAWP